MPKSEYTIPIVGHALIVQMAVEQIAMTPQAKAIIWLAGISDMDINAGIKLVQTITPDTEFEQKLVAKQAEIKPNNIAICPGMLHTIGLKTFCIHKLIPYISSPIADA